MSVGHIVAAGVFAVLALGGLVGACWLAAESAGRREAAALRRRIRRRELGRTSLEALP